MFKANFKDFICFTALLLQTKMAPPMANEWIKGRAHWFKPRQKEAAEWSKSKLQAATSSFQAPESLLLVSFSLKEWDQSHSFHNRFLRLAAAWMTQCMFRSDHTTSPMRLIRMTSWVMRKQKRVCGAPCGSASNASGGLFPNCRYEPRFMMIGQIREWWPFLCQAPPLAKAFG